MLADRYFISCTSSITFNVLSLSRPLGCCGFRSDPSMGVKFLRRWLVAGLRRLTKSRGLVGLPGLIHIVDRAGIADIDAAFSGFDLLRLRRRRIGDWRQYVMM